jgi:hypothetical protein
LQDGSVFFRQCGERKLGPSAHARVIAFATLGLVNVLEVRGGNCNVWITPSAKTMV